MGWQIIRHECPTPIYTITVYGTFYKDRPLGTQQVGSRSHLKVKYRHFCLWESRMGTRPCFLLLFSQQSGVRAGPGDQGHQHHLRRGHSCALLMGESQRGQQPHLSHHPVSRICPSGTEEALSSCLWVNDPCGKQRALKPELGYHQKRESICKQYFLNCTLGGTVCWVHRVRGGCHAARQSTRE